MKAFRTSSYPENRLNACFTFMIKYYQIILDSRYRLMYSLLTIALWSKIYYRPSRKQIEIKVLFETLERDTWRVRKSVSHGMGRFRHVR